MNMLLAEVSNIVSTNITALPDVPTSPADWVNVLILAVTPIIIAGIKWLMPKVPKMVLPILAPLLGIAVDQLAAFATGHQSNLVLAALLGASGLWLREAIDQAKKQITKEPSTDTKT